MKISEELRSYQPGYIYLPFDEFADKAEALEAREARLLAVARAVAALVADEESQEGGWGPDVTMLLPLKAALAAVEDLL